MLCDDVDLWKCGARERCKRRRYMYPYTALCSNTTLQSNYMLIKNKITNNKKEVLKRTFHQRVEIKKKTKLSELAETKFLF